MLNIISKVFDMIEEKNNDDIEEIKNLFESYEGYENHDFFWKQTLDFLHNTDINNICFFLFQENLNKMFNIYLHALDEKKVVQFLSSFFNCFYKDINSQNFYSLWLFEDILKSNIPNFDSILLECIYCTNKKYQKNLICFIQRYKNNIDWISTKSLETNLTITEILFYDCLYELEINNVLQNLVILNSLHVIGNYVSSDKINLSFCLSLFEKSFQNNEEIPPIITCLVKKFGIINYDSTIQHKNANFFKSFPKSINSVKELQDYCILHHFSINDVVTNIYDLFNCNFLCYVNNHFLFEIIEKKIFKSAIQHFLKSSYYNYDNKPIKEQNIVFYNRNVASSIKLIDVYSIPHGFENLFYQENKESKDELYKEALVEKCKKSYKKFSIIASNVFPKTINDDIFNFVCNFSKLVS